MLHRKDTEGKLKSLEEENDEEEQVLEDKEYGKCSHSMTFSYI